jgi:hypothetical protein
MWMIFSLPGILCILLGNFAMFQFTKRSHGLLAFLIISTGFVLLSFQWFILPIPIVIGIADIVCAILLWLPLRIVESAAENNIPVILSPLFRLFFFLFSLSLGIIFFPAVGVITQNPPALLLVPSLCTLILCFISIGLSTHPLRVGINLISAAQSFSLLYFWVEPSLLVVGLFSLVFFSLALAFSFFSSSSMLFQQENHP